METIINVLVHPVSLKLYSSEAQAPMRMRVTNLKCALMMNQLFKVKKLISPLHSDPRAFCFSSQIRDIPLPSQGIGGGGGWDGVRQDQQLLLVNLQDQFAKTAI